MSDVGKLNPIKAAPLAEKRGQVTEEKFHEVSELYEKYFIREMMKQMRSTVQEGGFIKQSNAEKIFRDQLDDQYADQWTKAGGIGLSDLIYDQLMDKFGAQMGLRKPLDRPQGPIELNSKANFTGVVGALRPAAAAPANPNPTANPDSNPNLGPNLTANRQETLTLKLKSDEASQGVVTSPWAGTLLEKKYMDADQIQYRIKHDNGLESLIMTRGTGLGPEQKLAAGDILRAGQALGLASPASPLFWTVKANVSE
jgi:flagellar protein FlgJ